MAEHISILHVRYTTFSCVKFNKNMMTRRFIKWFSFHEVGIVSEVQKHKFLKVQTIFVKQTLPTKKTYQNDINRLL